MRHLILTFAVVAFSIFSVNATNKSLNTTTYASTVTKNAIAQIFEWKVKTNKGIYSGTALSLKEAKKLMQLSTSGEIVISKSVQSFFILKSEINKNNNRNYFWEVETKTGKAKGYASNKAYAEKMIAWVASGDTVVSKIIISQPQQ
ncbi:hypothetical protein PW52_10885 [Tamlana sedimentorum]|uniref:Uncharacterized protein n=1 Tax=Neotamlana sedimentorum TaxID=1435349 RepID=A0A0D7W7Q6_9FLAO|nr:hypothetical protein [Tamlana sedimentorum]KJD35180.1 hypothetical protein PW52_10885 [Tamlana sedimentorum]